MKCPAPSFIVYLDFFNDGAFRMTTLSRASIIVLCYNGLEETTRPCLESIIANTPIDSYELIIVDNASSDGTPDYLKTLVAQHAHVSIQLNDSNKGYSGGNNDGMKLARGQYIILLNNDTLVPVGWLDKLLGLFSKQANVGLVGPVTNSAGNEQRVGLVGLNEQNYEDIAAAYTNRQQGLWFATERLGFFCVAMRREVLGKVGYLDENFGIGMFEDDDYCVRVKKAGFTLAVVEDCFVYHKGSVSFSKLDTEHYRELFDKNKAYFRKKHRLEWTLTDIALSYWKKFDKDLLAYVRNNQNMTSEIERMLIRFENFKHVLLQIHQVELASVPANIRGAASHKMVARTKWQGRWQHFKRNIIHGTYTEKWHYVRALRQRVLHRDPHEQIMLVQPVIQIPEDVCLQLTAIREELDGRPLMIFPATVDYHYMTQRPQHLARAFAASGYVVIYGTLNRQMDKVAVSERAADNLYLLNEYYFQFLSQVFIPKESIYYCLWPNNIKHLDYLPYSYLLYDYMDDLSLLDLPAGELAHDHKVMLNQADLVTVSAGRLMAQLPEHILPKALLVNNAVSQEFIEVSNAYELNVKSLTNLGDRPILGYYGAIAEWLDFDLIESLAQALHDVRIVLIGPVSEKVSKQVADLLWNHSNIVVLPTCKQLELIPFLHRFDVCLIPFIKNTVTEAVSPVKLFEYFSAGKPVVSTNLPECNNYAPVRIAQDHHQFIAIVRAILIETSIKIDETAQHIALNNTWSQRIQQIESVMKARTIS